MVPLRLYHLQAMRTSRSLFKRNFQAHGRLSTFVPGLAPKLNGGKVLPYQKCPLGTPTRRVLSGMSGSSLHDWGQHSIFVSTSDDPYFNLSLEDMLFRKHDPQKPLLLIYRDKPCVVIGRNQNPWKEVNMQELERLQIPFIRRRSGGGTVYHDLGNTNFSIHLPRASFDRHATGQTVLRAVRSLGIDVRVNDRNDICVGSAYKIVNNRAYHHGTMLLSTKLDTLGDLLRVKNKDQMVTKGVASVRSPVCNLQQFSPKVSHEAFTNALVSQFQKEYLIDQEPFLVPDSQEFGKDPEIRKGMEELPTWQWAYGQTPEFTYQVHQAFSWGALTLNLRSKHGIVLECTSQLSGSFDESGEIADYINIELGASLVGQRYGFLTTTTTAMGRGKGKTENMGSAKIAAVLRDVNVWISDIA